MVGECGEELAGRRVSPRYTDAFMTLASIRLGNSIRDIHKSLEQPIHQLACPAPASAPSVAPTTVEHFLE